MKICWVRHFSIEGSRKQMCQHFLVQ
jgi:hypothetical protein